MGCEILFKTPCSQIATIMIMAKQKLTVHIQVVIQFFARYGLSGEIIAKLFSAFSSLVRQSYLQRNVFSMTNYSHSPYGLGKRKCSQHQIDLYALFCFTVTSDSWCNTKHRKSVVSCCVCCFVPQIFRVTAFSEKPQLRGCV